jgi:hypothetical protein
MNSFHIRRLVDHPRAQFIAPRSYSGQAFTKFPRWLGRYHLGLFQPRLELRPGFEGCTVEGRTLNLFPAHSKSSHLVRRGLIPQEWG